MNLHRPKRAFTLIELLTVIAIIAVVAAILFPVFGRVRENARQSTCFSQMHDIWQSVGQYYTDNQKYPAALLGFVQGAKEYVAPDGSSHNEFWTSDGANGSALGINQLTYKPLMAYTAKYIKSTTEFICPDSSNTDPAATVSSVIYPANVPLAGQAVVFTKEIAHNIGDNVFDPALLTKPASFYPYDSYDSGPQVTSAGTAVSPTVMELHYSLDWTGAASSQGDNQNQLKYPSLLGADHTVLTWCTYHAAVAHTGTINVMFLSGTSKPVNIAEWSNKGPLGY